MLQRADGTLSAAGAQAAGMQMELDRLRVQLGGLESRSVAALGPHEIASAEFQVFSQFGDDGIIQFLVQRVPVENEVFVEFGVEDYHESNTRFLLVHDNWRGLVMDGGTSHVEFLRGRELAWRHYVDAKTAWVDRDNINGLIEGAGIAGDIGLLSVDIDGNDYWVARRSTPSRPASSCSSTTASSGRRRGHRPLRPALRAGREALVLALLGRLAPGARPAREPQGLRPRGRQQGGEQRLLRAP